jgi:hypothetical protein
LSGTKCSHPAGSCFNLRDHLLPAVTFTAAIFTGFRTIERGELWVLSC